MNVFTMLEPFWLPIVAVVLVLLTGTFLVTIHHRRVARQSSGTAETHRASPSLLRLRQSFRQASAMLKRHVPGRRARDHVPWFMLVGEAAAGKTTLLHGAGLSMPFGAPAAAILARREGCTWWFFDHGMVLDTAGDYVLRGDGGTSDALGWRTFLRLLQRYRPERPISGIIVAIPCTEMVGPPEQQPARVAKAAHKATRLYEKLWEAQRVLGLRLPVYLLLTKCDQIHGFAPFCEALPAFLRQDIFGWSNPYTLEAAYAPHWVDEAMDALGEQLVQLQLEVMAEDTPLQDGDGFFLFPGAFQAIREPLRAYVDHLFTSSAYHDTLFFRGLYVCGDGRLDGPRAPARPEPAADTLPPMPTVPTSALAGVRQLCFLKQLFEAKVFPEHRLASPAARAFAVRSRAVLSVQVLLLALTLVGGGGLWRAYHRLLEAKGTLQPVLQEITTDVERRRSQHTASEIQFGKETFNLLRGMANANASGLQSLFFPSSWFDPLHGEIVQAITGAYNTVILQSIVAEFQRKAHHILQSSMSRADLAADSAPPLSIERLPEFTALQRFTEALGEFEKHAALYNTHVAAAGANDLQTLGHVVKYLFGSDLSAEFYHNAHYYKEALAHASSQTIDPMAYKEAARARIQALARPLYDRLFAANPALVSVQNLAQAFERLKRQRPAEVTTQALRDLLDAMTRTQTALARPELARLSSTTLDLGEPFERLVATMAGSETLGPETSDEFRKAGDAAFQKFQLALKTPRFGTTGPLLQQDGALGRLELASGMLALRESLGNFLGLEFVKRDAQRTMRTELLPKTHLIWDVRLLEEALRLYEPYSRFRGEELKHFPADILRQVEAVALRHLRANLSDLIAQGQIIAPSPDGFGQTRVEAGISPEIRNLQTASPLLGRLVDICNDAGLGDMSWSLLTLVSTQALGLLETVDQLLQSEHPYAIKDNNVAWWRGDPGVALAAFEVRDGKELAVYLGLQRDRLKHLARAYAEPLVGFLTHRPRQRTPRQESVVARWQGILAELEHYDNKKPGNAVQALETFIAQDMEQLTTQNCQQMLTAASSTETSSDFFSQHRSNLRREFSRRCQVLTQELLGQEYARIAQAFNQHLAGKFPFRTDEVGEPDVEAEPQAIRDFYQVFDASAQVVRDLLTTRAKPVKAPDQALAFLEHMQTVRAFFAPFLDGETQPDGPAFDLAVDFRVNRPRERGGNQIIDWQLSVGEQSLRARDAERQGRWHFGDPLRVALRWAKDAPIEPVSSGAAPQVEVHDGTVVYTYRNRWSLLRLLRRQASAAADFDRFADPRPHTLKFVVDTRPKPDKSPEAGSASLTETKVFIGVTVMAPGKKAGLVLPAMPGRAPELSLSPALASSN